ncbi:hypothetical protein DBB_28530 [Desulfoluna spongiiphila]|nr:hypothetical protein DBB_28530 [Desulfoluna spongiiphila]
MEIFHGSLLCNPGMGFHACYYDVPTQPLGYRAQPEQKSVAICPEGRSTTETRFRGGSPRRRRQVFRLFYR